MARLKGRVALITGGSRGIGLAISKAMAAEGARVAINGYHPEAALAAAESIGGAAFPADVRDGQAVQKMVDDVVAHFGSLDILVANAGVMLSVHRFSIFNPGRSGAAITPSISARPARHLWSSRPCSPPCSWPTNSPLSP